MDGESDAEGAGSAAGCVGFEGGALGRSGWAAFHFDGVGRLEHRRRHLIDRHLGHAGVRRHVVQCAAITQALETRFKSIELIIKLISLELGWTKLG